MAPPHYKCETARREWAHEAWVARAEGVADWRDLASRRSRINPFNLYGTRGGIGERAVADADYSPDARLEKSQEEDVTSEEDSTVRYSLYEQYLATLHPAAAQIYRLHCEGKTQPQIARQVGMTQASVSHRLSAIHNTGPLFKAVREAQRRLLDALPSLEWRERHKQQLTRLLEIGSVARAAEALQCSPQHLRALINLPLSPSQRDDLCLILSRGTRALGLHRETRPAGSQIIGSCVSISIS